MTFSKYKHTISWAAITVFFFAFAQVYNMFGHGVYAWQMTFNFVPALLLMLLYFFTESVRWPFLISRSWWFINLGVLWIIIGLILWGIFLIAGTGSKMIYVFYILGVISILFGFIKVHRIDRDSQASDAGLQIKL